MTKTQDTNWHTLDQIKAMGNRIIANNTNDDDRVYALLTQRGNTVTCWVEEDDKYHPVDAKVRD